MRRILGAVMMLAGAYALYWVWRGAGGRMPDHVALVSPVTQYVVCGVLLVIIGMVVFRSYRPPLKNIMVCPNCGKTIQKGRRNCPFCKEELIHY
jgi:branched-subunit amino acid ABC-type transport system permease component